MSEQAGQTTTQHCERRETFADAARAFADLIEAIPNAITHSFAGGADAKARTAALSSETAKLLHAAMPVVSWLERQGSPAAVDPFKKRLMYVVNGAGDCAGFDIPEYATGQPKRVSDTPSEAAGSVARLTVHCHAFARWCRDLAGDIEARERTQKRDSTRRKRSRAGGSSRRPVERGTASASCPPVVLGAQGEPVSVLGKPKRPLTDAQFRAVKKLLDAGDQGLNKDGLEAPPDGGARAALKNLRKDADWAKVISLPGTRGKGYRIIDPRKRGKM